MSSLPNDIDPRTVFAEWAERFVSTRRPDGASDTELAEFCRSDAVYEATLAFAASVETAWEQTHPSKPLRVAAPKTNARNTDLPAVESVHSAAAGELECEKALPKVFVEAAVGLDSLAKTASEADLKSQWNACESPKPVEAQSSLVRSAVASTATTVGRVELVTPRGNANGRERAQAMKFSLPNAKAGQSYEARIICVEEQADTVIFRNVIIPQGLGVSFDEAKGQILGEPLLAGEHQVSFQWGGGSDGWRSGECALLVNPDPRSLWKKIDPPTDDPYFKSHIAGETVVCERYRISAGSRRGRSHEHVGSFRDDDYLITHDRVSGWSVMIVCDGAGSAKSSRMGSKIACETAGARLVAALRGEAGTRVQAGLDEWDDENKEGAKTVGLEFHALFHESAKAAVLAIEEEAKSKQSQARDYATTMLAAAVKRVGSQTFVATFWMGDGAIGVYGPKGKIRLMGTPDGGEFAGQTRFLDRAAITDQNFSNRLRVGKYSDVTAVILMTDGISDPIFETENALSDPARWDHLWKQIQGSLGADSPHDKLVDWMDFFASGHHDDRTIAVLW